MKCPHIEPRNEYRIRGKGPYILFVLILLTPFTVEVPGEPRNTDVGDAYTVEQV